MNWLIFIPLINVLVWPLVVAGFLFFFRKPLATLITGLGGRLTKLSAFQFSLELATLPGSPLPWFDPNIPENSEMTGGDVSSTALTILFQRIGVITPWDYLIVDIKDGHFWLISRVFIFTVFLQAMRGVKCVVFVESKGDFRRRLIGLASPDAVLLAMCEAYPWLEQALSKAMNMPNTFFLRSVLSPDTASQIIRRFIEDPEMRKDVLPSPPDKWTQLGTQPIWEHTEWLNAETFSKYLSKALFEWDSSHYKDTLDIQTDKRMRELLFRKAPFIALVNSKEEFQRLLDRQKLLEQLAQSLQNE